MGDTGSSSPFESHVAYVWTSRMPDERSGVNTRSIGKQQRKPAYTVFAMYEHQYCERVMLPCVNSSAARVVSSDE